jgi:DNA-directed RNA polymerase
LDQNLLALNYEELLKHYNLKDTNIDDSYKVFNLELIKAFKLKNYSLVKTLASKLSILQHMIIIKQILNENLENKKIYLPFKIDFRGRIYFLSSITPTNN